jgi:hypothetical protein
MPSSNAQPAPAPGAPAVSVLVPTYNYARFLPEALASVLAQNFRDFEVIVSDDASTDGSASVLREFAARDPRVRCTIQPVNLGMIGNWNWCLGQARGRHLKFLFGDDVLASPDSLGRLVALLDAEPRAQIAASARWLIDGRSQIFGLADELRGGFHDGPALIARCLRTRTNLIGEPSVVMFRRPDFPASFRDAYRQIVDLEMWFQQLMHGGLVYTPEPLCGFRCHGEQQTVVNHRSERPHIEMLQLLEQYAGVPCVAAHLPPGGRAHQQMLFCQLHYARKSGVRAPEFLAAMERLDRQLTPGWRLVCWLVRRLANPVQKFRRRLLHRCRRIGARPWWAGLGVR